MGYASGLGSIFQATVLRALSIVCRNYVRTMKDVYCLTETLLKRR